MHFAFQTLVALLLCASGAAASAATASVNCTSGGACVLVDSTSADAVATYDVTTNLTSGFATLDVIGRRADGGGVDDADALRVARAAGYAEGWLTAAEMAQFFVNVYEFGASGPAASLVAFVEENDAWVRAQAAASAATDDYWQAVAMVRAPPPPPRRADVQESRTRDRSFAPGTSRARPRFHLRSNVGTCVSRGTDPLLQRRDRDRAFVYDRTRGHVCRARPWTAV